MSLEELLKRETEENKQEKTGSGSLYSRVKRSLKSAAALTGLGTFSTLAGGSASWLLAAGFNLGNYLEKKIRREKVTRSDVKAETITGWLTGIMHSPVYAALGSIPNGTLYGKALRSAGVLLYSIPYIAVTKGLKYLSKKYAESSASEFVTHMIKHPLKSLKEGFLKGTVPGYVSTLKSVWKKMGLPLALNINYTPAEYRIPVSVGLGAWYRKIQGKHSYSR